MCSHCLCMHFTVVTWSSLCDNRQLYIAYSSKFNLQYWSFELSSVLYLNWMHNTIGLAFFSPCFWNNLVFVRWKKRNADIYWMVYGKYPPKKNYIQRDISILKMILYDLHKKKKKFISCFWSMSVMSLMNDIEYIQISIYSWHFKRHFKTVFLLLSFQMTYTEKYFTLYIYVFIFMKWSYVVSFDKEKKTS